MSKRFTKLRWTEIQIEDNVRQTEDKLHFLSLTGKVRFVYVVDNKVRVSVVESLRLRLKRIKQIGSS
jgi:ribosomal protein L27